MTRKNIIAQHVYTAREYTQTFPEMRGGDIFMGAFDAEQVMYNHFGYRTPVERLYMAGSACHPGGAISGGAGYISAGIIARDLGLKLWWKPWDAGEALRAMRSSAARALTSGCYSMDVPLAPRMPSGCDPWMGGLKGVPPASFARKLGAIVRRTRAAGELQAGDPEFGRAQDRASGAIDHAILRLGVADGEAAAGLQHHRDDVLRRDLLFGDGVVQRRLVGLDDDFLQGLRVLHVAPRLSFAFAVAQATSKRSAFITLVHAATKSFTNFSFESAHA